MVETKFPEYPTADICMGRVVSYRNGHVNLPLFVLVDRLTMGFYWKHW